jgi:hypothetical protein
MVVSAMANPASEDPVTTPDRACVRRGLLVALVVSSMTSVVAWIGDLRSPFTCLGSGLLAGGIALMGCGVRAARRIPRPLI